MLREHLPRRRRPPGHRSEDEWGCSSTGLASKRAELERLRLGPGLGANLLISSNVNPMSDNHLQNGLCATATRPRYPIETCRQRSRLRYGGTTSAVFPLPLGPRHVVIQASGSSHHAT